MSDNTLKICQCSKLNLDKNIIDKNINFSNYDDKLLSKYWKEINYNNQNKMINNILWGTKWYNLPNNTLTYTINQGNKDNIKYMNNDTKTVANINKIVENSVDFIMKNLQNYIDLKIEKTNNVKEAFISINFLNGNTDNYNYLGLGIPPENKNSEYYETVSNFTNLTDSFYCPGNAYIIYKEGQDYNIGSFMYCVMLHEIGHILGLAHPHDNGGNSSILSGVNNAFDFGNKNNNLQPITVMSYNDYNSPILQDTIKGSFNGNIGDSSGYMGTFGPLDIEALQYMYGKNIKYNISNSVYKLSNENKYWFCIYDNSGIDTIDASDSYENTNININNSDLDENLEYAGVKFSNNIFGGIMIAKSSDKIENVIGSSHDDNIIGNNMNNIFDISSGGNDIVDGKDGYDIVYLKSINYEDVLINIDNDFVTIKYNNDTISLINIEKIIFLDKEIVISKDIIESGSVILDKNLKTVTLTKSFKNPILCLNESSFDNKNLYIKIESITNNSFTLKLENINSQNSDYSESVNYIVGEKGIWTSYDNKKIIFDSYTSNNITQNGLDTIDFNSSFNEKPVIFPQLITNNYISSKIKNITLNNFELSLQISENSKNLNVKEKIHWCAFSPGNYIFKNLKIESGIVKNVNNNFKRVFFSRNFFSNSPRIILRGSSFNQNNTFIVKFNSEKQENSEVSKIENEDIYFIAIE